MKPQPRFSSWGSRVGAAMLDGLIVWSIAFVAIFAAAIVAAPFGGADDFMGWLWALLSLIGACGYVGLTMTRNGEHNGQTLGKQAAGIRVVRDDGKPVSAGTVAAREVGLKWIAGNATGGLFFLVDSVWPLGERENRALHDLIVKTHVVDTTPAPLPMQIQPPPWGAPRPQLAPPIARHVYAAQTIQARIGETVQRAQLPYADVCHEVSSLVGLMQQSAQRAQLLHDALSESPPARRAPARRARGLGQDRADRSAAAPADGPAADGVPARALQRRARARRRRAGHGARQPAQRLRVQ
jgi:uncharacterized RDD family membrane protein YckC